MTIEKRKKLHEWERECETLLAETLQNEIRLAAYGAGIVLTRIAPTDNTVKRDFSFMKYPMKLK